METLLNIVTLGLKIVYDRTNQYFLIVKDFREKLPRPQNQAKSLNKNEIDSHHLLKHIPSLKLINVIDTSNHKQNITEVELDVFYDRLNDFDYRYVVFKKHYKEFTKDLLRYNPKSQDKDFDLIFLQNKLQNNSIPLKPFEVLVYHLKFKYKITSKSYSWFLRKKGENN